ncbi:MAG: hypothetical protein WA838_18480 [Xanthobacteraceae bacterium]
MARLDRLGRAKEIAQIASVIGRQFSYEMLEAIAGDRVNWIRMSSRNRMRRQGVEDIKGKMPLVGDQPPKQPRRKLSKAELREQAAAAFLAWREGQTAKDE